MFLDPHVTISSHISTVMLGLFLIVPFQAGKIHGVHLQQLLQVHTDIIIPRVQYHIYHQLGKVYIVCTCLWLQFSVHFLQECPYTNCEHTVSRHAWSSNRKVNSLNHILQECSRFTRDCRKEQRGSGILKNFSWVQKSNRSKG